MEAATVRERPSSRHIPIPSTVNTALVPSREGSERPAESRKTLAVGDLLAWRRHCGADAFREIRSIVRG